jgi:hypothetical protein
LVGAAKCQCSKGPALLELHVFVRRDSRRICVARATRSGDLG